MEGFGQQVAEMKQKLTLHAERRRAHGGVKKPTLAECEKRYTTANILYQQYLDNLVKSKFGKYTTAAKAVKRSRAHLNDCIAGRRGLDSVRRLVDKMENAPQP